MYPSKPPDLDDDLRPIKQSSMSGPKPPDLDDKGLPPAEPGFISKAWDVANKSLFDYMPDAINPAKLAKADADRFDVPSDKDWTIPFSGGATWKGLGAGMNEGAGQVINSLASPLNLATMGMGAGEYVGAKAGLPAVAKLMRMGTQVASAPVAFHGAKQVLSPESTWRERGMGLTELAGGAAGMFHAPHTAVKPKGSIVEPLNSGGNIPHEIPAPDGSIVLDKPDMPTITRLTNEGYIASMNEHGQVIMTKSVPKTTTTTLPKPTKNTLIESDPFEEIDLTSDLEEPNPLFAEHNARQVARESAKTPEFDDIPPDQFFAPQDEPHQFPGDDVYDLGNMPHWGPEDVDMNTGELIEPKSTDINVPQPIKPIEASKPGFFDRLASDESGEFDADAILGPDPNKLDTMEKTDNASIGKQYGPERPPVKEGNIAPEQWGDWGEGNKFPPLGLDETGSTVAKPSFADQVLPPEFSPDIKQTNVDVPELGGTTPDFSQQVLGEPEPLFTPPVKPRTVMDRINDFMKDESGEGNIGDNIPEGQVIHLKNPSLDKLKAAMAAGFEYAGEVRADGAMKLIKTAKSRETPVLESEVGEHRPTGRAARGQLGPVTDVKKASNFVEAFNLSRSLKASIDLSAPLRQGIGLIHKKAFWTSLKPMLESWMSEGGFEASQQGIAKRALFKQRPGKDGKMYPSFAEDAGLKLTDLTDQLTNREESLQSTWAEKVPGVRASNRAYTAFLNNLRADTFESLIKNGQIFGADAKANLPLARELANFVNTASGRGHLGKLESSAVALNSVLFAPRLIAARLQMLNPHYYITANPMVRKEALKSLFAIAAVGNTLTQLGRMAGGEVSANPTSSDFGKLKIGNTRLDPYAGFQQYIVAATRIMSGKSTSSNVAEGQEPAEYDLDDPQRPFDPNRMDIMKRFARGKLHPTLGFAYDILDGSKDMAGKPLDFGTTNPMENAISQQFIPLFIQDVYELAKTDPKLLPLAIPSGFGMGIQSYEPR